MVPKKPTCKDVWDNSNPGSDLYKCTYMSEIRIKYAFKSRGKKQIRIKKK